MIGTLMNWSETWALLIPLITWWRHPLQPAFMRPVLLYLVMAFLLNLSADAIGHAAMKYHPDKTEWWYSNTRIYNLHSFIRFLLLLIFLFKARLISGRWLGITTVVFLVGILIIEAIGLESILNRDSINSSLHTLEAILLIVLCMVGFFKIMDLENADMLRSKVFWLLTSISVYCVANFFVFLFYSPMLRTSQPITFRLWYLHNIAFIIYCIFTSIAIYVSNRNPNSA